MHSYPGGQRTLPSLSVVQLQIGVSNGDARLFQIADGASDVSRRHVVPRIVVVSNYKDSRVMTIRGPDNKVVESLEVFIIPRQDGSMVTDGMGQVNLVTVSN